MEWLDEAIVLSARPHGETSAVVTLLTEHHGRHAGLVRGGQNSKSRAVYQPGNRVRAHWRARLADHLGSFDEADRLTALSAAAAVSERALPEREPHPACFHGFLALLEAIEGDHWGSPISARAPAAPFRSPPASPIASACWACRASWPGAAAAERRRSVPA
jgi:DNA repair protein RecO (recombination protein O)